MPIEYHKIRPVSLLVAKHEGRMLVMPGYDKVKEQPFFRLVGGGVEFGETSQEALEREIKEELGADLKNCRLLEVIENIFTYNGDQAQEICFIYEADFVDQSFYERKEIPVLDEPEFTAFWVEMTAENVSRLKPEGCDRWF